MMPFGKTPKGFAAHSGDEDRKNIIKQMKIRTIIKGDKSWIHKPNDTEGQTIELSPSTEHCPAVTPLMKTRKDRPAAIKPSTGYIIRGVFTKPVDSTSLPQSQFPTTFEKPKRSTFPSKSLSASLPRLSGSSYKINTDDFSKKMVEAVEEETPPERSKTLPALARQRFGLNSGKREETRTLQGRDPKQESTILDPSPESSRKRAFLDCRERVVSSNRTDHPREENKDAHLDADRSSTWSTDSNHGSTGSQHDLDEVEVTSKKGTPFLYRDRFISNTQGGAYEGPAKLQPVEHKDLSRFGSEECGAFSPNDQYNRPVNLQYCIPIKNTAKYGSASTVTASEKRYSAKPDDVIQPEPRRFAASSVGTANQRFETLPSVEDMMTSDRRSSLSGYEERSVTTIVREARWDNPGHPGAKGGNRPETKIHYSDYRVITPDPGLQMPLKGSNQDSSSRRNISTSGERTPMGGMAASAQDGASLLNCEPSSNAANKSILLVKEYTNVREPPYARPSLRLSKMTGGVTCTYCCKEIRSEPKITLEHLGICCHEYCFKCGICKRKMGNMLDQVYIHNGIIHCDQCYSRLF
ncbi:zinc finger protein 185 isoform X1 [Monodelphis domestica]|uniref:Zinc finger protein 185 with LIM domain n=1 Tax=Monodelphis domestica TaxID=13616 RepID=K7E213_MONDO|nr:zinc finger protein 185 isoform X1 [Monodelphis domestica]